MAAILKFKMAHEDVVKQNGPKVFWIQHPQIDKVSSKISILARKSHGFDISTYRGVLFVSLSSWRDFPGNLCFLRGVCLLFFRGLRGFILLEAFLRDISLKTVFLVAITAGHRVSALHALCLDHGHLRWETSGLCFIKVDIMLTCHSAAILVKSKDLIGC